MNINLSLGVIPNGDKGVGLPLLRNHFHGSRDNGMPGMEPKLGTNTASALPIILSLWPL